MKRTLILFASKHSCTEDCAYILSKELNNKVDICNIEKNKNIDLNLYDTVIIGGSIYAGSIQKSIKEYCQQNISILSSKRLGLFICCGFAKQSKEYFEKNFPESLLKNSMINACFGGEFRFATMGFFEKSIVKMVQKKHLEEPKILYDKIKNFALEIL